MALVNKVYKQEKAYLLEDGKVVFDVNDAMATNIEDISKENYKEVTVVLCSKDIYRWYEELETQRYM